MTDLFSNEFFQLSLEDLKWEHSESATRAWETITFKEIEKESQFFAMMLRGLNKPIKFGDYVYSLSGSNRIERHGPLVVKKRSENKLFTISQVFKRKPMPQPEPGKGLRFEKESPKVLD